MKLNIVKLACSAMLGAAIAGSAFTGTAQAQTAGSLAPLVASSGTEAKVLAETVNHRGRHHRRYNRHNRHHRGGGIYFDFGNGSFSLNAPPQRYYPRQRRNYGHPRATQSHHVNWCYSRYKTYRHWDNTFQPYHGGRRQCVSPYY